MPLDEYRRKRDFSATNEPAGADAVDDGPQLRYLVQKHAARALHYDFRLELDGVLLSWAIPKGPSLDTHDKRLAVHVEDHPLEYGDFEGTIPAGEYGGGTVIVWDTGWWRPVGDPHVGLEKGDLKFDLFGSKLQGRWVLVRMRPRPGEKRENWLLIKEKDALVRPSAEYDIIAEQPDSALSGRSIEDVAGAVNSGASATLAHPTDAPVALETHAYPEGAAQTSPFPAAIDLELATLVAAPPDGGDWIAEVKYDGYRAVIALDGGRARVFTRSHADWTDRFGALGRAAEALPADSAIIDGEAVVFDVNGVSRFGLLQGALGSAPERISFAAFDLHYLNGYDLRSLPLLRRKELLRSLLGAEPGSGAPASTLHYVDHVAGASAEFFRAACSSGLEGIVCKRADSHYVSGRGRDWQKVKCRQTQELVVGGFTEGAGSRSALGSLLVGVYEADQLVYAGRVGTGFDEAGLVAMRARLEPLLRDTPAFAVRPRVSGHVIHWTEPTLVVQAAFREWTADGHLRQPVFLGMREDKDPREVTRESTAVPETGADHRTKNAQFGPDAQILGVTITNPDKTLFPDSPLTKLDFASYYAQIAPLMLAETAGRPLTLMRCPVGHGRGCFYQRHPDAGLSPHVHVMTHTIKGEPVELLWVDSAEGLVALAQMGAVEVHTWLSRVDAPTRPDRLVFDLDPGPDVGWSQIRETALLVREECTGLGLRPFLRSTGSKGLHVVIPVEPVWEFDRMRALAKALAEQIATKHPLALTTKMAKSQRGGRVFLDYLRNAEGASAVACYSTRNLSGPSCAIPLTWDELTEGLDIRAFTVTKVLERVDAHRNPWEGIEEEAAGATILRRAESALAQPR